MHKCICILIRIESIIYFMICYCHCMSYIPGSQCFSKHDNIRKYKIRHKTISSTSETSCNFIKYKNNIIFIAKFSCPSQEINTIHFHPAGSLKKWLYNKCIKFISVCPKYFFQCIHFRWNVNYILLIIF